MLFRSALLVASNSSNVAVHEHGSTFMTPLGVKANASSFSMAHASPGKSMTAAPNSDFLGNSVAIFSTWIRLDIAKSIISNITPISPLALQGTLKTQN